MKVYLSKNRKKKATKPPEHRNTTNEIKTQKREKKM